MIYKYYQDIKEEKLAEKIFFIFIYIMIIFYLIVFVGNIAFQNSYIYVTIRGTSMQPTLNPDPIFEDGAYQDAVYVRLTKDIDYGEIIIIDKSNGDENTTIIKRVLGLEGDKITIAKLPIQKEGEIVWEYRVIRIKDSHNAKVEILNEDYLSGYVYGVYKDGYDEWNKERSVIDESDSEIGITTIAYESAFYEQFLLENENIVIESVPYNGEIYSIKFFVVGSDKTDDEPDQVFYLGDNRIGSTDARFEGTEDIDKVVGRVISIVHDGYSLKSNPLGWLNNLKEYIKIIWNEIVRYFSVID